MEIYRNEPTTVKFKAPLTNATYSVTVKSPKHESLIQSLSPQNDVGWNTTVLNIPVDFAHTWYDGTIEFAITVNGGTPTVQHTYSEYVDVITPLFTFHDLGGEYPADKTPELERLVRKVVEAYTGQYFGRKIERIPVEASERIISFNVPIIEFTGVSDRYLTHSTTLNPPKMPYEIINDGFSLMVDFENYHVKTDSTWVLGQKDKCPTYVIQGTFGYNSVPTEVKEAALLIAGVWGCKQAVWRDRFIQTMRSADWSVGYNQGAFGASTGSVTADQLLAKFQRRYQPEVI